MNNCVFVGRISYKQDLAYSSGENATARLNFGMALQRHFKNKQTGEYDADFINLTAWGSTAEFIDKYFTKGQMIAVTAEARTDKYTDKNGNEVNATKFNVNNAEFASSKSDNPQNNGNSGSNSNQNDDFMNIPQGVDEKLPFV